MLYVIVASLVVLALKSLGCLPDSREEVKERGRSMTLPAAHIAEDILEVVAGVEGLFARGGHDARSMPAKTSTPSLLTSFVSLGCLQQKAEL